MKILNDPSLLFDNERIKKKIENVKKDKQSMVDAASDYNNKYKQEIDDGTRKTQLLIEDGKKKGLKEEDVLKGSFTPCVRTPILNWLYFLLRENTDEVFEESRNEYNKQYGHLEDDYDYKNSGVLEEPKELDTFIYGSMTHKQYQTVKKLKTLALSNGKCNENESALAFSMCKELCRKYSLEFDKVNINN